MKKNIDFIWIEAYDGNHIIRVDLIKSISPFVSKMYPNDVQIDIKTKLNYDTDDCFYFAEDIISVAKRIAKALKEGWEV